MYSNYCRHSLLCTKYFVYVCVRVCYELSMSINIVQCSLHKLNKRPTDLPQEFTNRYSNIRSLQPSPLTKGFDSDFQLWSNWGLSHGADYFSLFLEIIQESKWHLYSDPLSNNIVHVIIAVNNCHQHRLPCWTDQQQSGYFCIIDLYDHHCWKYHYVFCTSQTPGFDNTAQRQRGSFFHSRGTKYSPKCKVITHTHTYWCIVFVDYLLSKITCNVHSRKYLSIQKQSQVESFGNT